MDNPGSVRVLFILSFLQVIEGLLCGETCARCWRYRKLKGTRSLLLWNLQSHGGDRNKQNYKSKIKNKTKLKIKVNIIVIFVKETIGIY